MSYFKKHWSTKLQGDVMKCVEEVVSDILTVSLACYLCTQFKERYLLMSRDLDVPDFSKSQKTKGGLRVLLRELSDDEDNVTVSPAGISADPDRPWAQHISAYMDVIEQVPDGWSAIKWWGVSTPGLLAI
jgi:hypothetical protein